MTQARALLAYSTEQLWQSIKPGRYKLVFDDGVEVITNDREILYSSYFWVFHKRYPDTPLKSTHHVRAVTKGGALTSDTHIQLLENVYWDVVDAYPAMSEEERDALTRLIYEVTNTLYSDLTYRLEPWVVSLDILDFIEVLEHPAVTQSLEELDASKEKIRNTYLTIRKTIRTDPALRNNPLAIVTKANAVKENQLLQCIGPRGYVSEVDGSSLEVPILRGLTKGLRTFYNMAVESLSVSRSYYYSEAPLQDSEYFARRLHLVAMIVERIERFKVRPQRIIPHEVVPGNCGSTRYFEWKLKAPVVVEGKTLYRGDLDGMEGKYYLDEEEGVLKRLNRTDTHLYGQIIKMRSPLTCEHPDPHVVCETCFGELAQNIPTHANLGHICATIMTQQISQSMLSARHYMGSVDYEPVILSGVTQTFLRFDNELSRFYLKKPEGVDALRLIIDSREAVGLTDVYLVENVHQINPSRVSALTGVQLAITNAEITQRYDLKLTYYARKATLSHDLLYYIKTNGYEVNDEGNFIIDLSRWNTEAPLFELPKKEYDFYKFSSEIVKLIESSANLLKERAKPESPFTILMEVFEKVNSKLDLNLACLEVIFYAYMCKDPLNGDFSLARKHPGAGLGVLAPIIANRSLSAAYAYEMQNATIFNPKSFFPQGRDDHIFDVFIAPREVIEDLKRSS